LAVGRADGNGDAVFLEDFLQMLAPLLQGADAVVHVEYLPASIEFMFHRGRDDFFVEGAHVGRDGSRPSGGLSMMERDFNPPREAPRVRGMGVAESASTSTVSRKA